MSKGDTTTVGYERPFEPDLSLVAPDAPAPAAAPAPSEPNNPGTERTGVMVGEGSVGIVGKPDSFKPVRGTKRQLYDYDPETGEMIPVHSGGRSPQSERKHKKGEGRPGVKLPNYKDVFGTGLIGDEKEAEKEEKDQKEKGEKAKITMADLRDKIFQTDDAKIGARFKDITYNSGGDPKKMLEGYLAEAVNVINTDDDYIANIRKGIDERNKAGFAQMEQNENEMRLKFDENQQKLEQAHKKVAQYDGLVREALERGVNPQNFWESRTTFAKVIGALSLGAGAFGGALTGKGNSALSIIQGAIAQDIAAQEKNLGFLKDAAALNRMSYDERVRLDDRRRKFRLEQTLRRHAQIINMLNSANENDLGRIEDREKSRALGMSLQKSALDFAIKDLDPQSLEDQLKIAKIRGEIAAQQQAYRHKEEARTIPAGQIAAPGLEGTTFTFSNPKDKDKVMQDRADLRKQVTSTDTVISSIDEFLNYVDVNKLSSSRLLVNLPTQAVRDKFNAVKKALESQVPAAHAAINPDPRMNEKELALARDMADAKYFEGSAWYTTVSAFTKQLQSIRHTYSFLASQKAHGLYDDLGAYSNQGSAANAASRKLFASRPGETIQQRNTRVLRALKRGFKSGYITPTRPERTIPPGSINKPPRPMRTGAGI